MTFHFRGNKSDLSICNLANLKTESPLLFQNLSDDCKPIAVKSRRYSEPDRKFIDSEIQQMLKEGIVEPINLPWRAQVVVTKSDQHKKRIVTDYPQTFNTFTQLDAYPLPCIDDFINKIPQYRVFSKTDSRSAYHQIPIHEDDKPHTALEGNKGLYHFNRMSFGITNALSMFSKTS